MSSFANTCTSVRYTEFFRSSRGFRQFALRRAHLPSLRLHRRLSCFLPACPSVVFAFRSVLSLVVYCFCCWRLDLYTRTVGARRCFLRCSWWSLRSFGKMALVLGTRYSSWTLALGVCIYCWCHTVPSPRLCHTALDVHDLRLVSLLWWRFVAYKGVRVVRRWGRFSNDQNCSQDAAFVDGQRVLLDYIFGKWSIYPWQQLVVYLFNSRLRIICNHRECWSIDIYKLVRFKDQCCTRLL